MKFFIGKYPFFLLLLPLFFFLHALLENYNPILIKDTLILFAIYSGAAILLATFFWLLYKNIQKASIMSFALMSVNFFFGSAYDFSKEVLGNSFLTRYSFILAIIFLLLIFLGLFLKKSDRKFLRTGIYLNILLLILISIDATMLAGHIFRKNKPNVTDLASQLRKCDTCTNPDIYLIVADEYAGKKELEDIFSFDNSEFENALSNRGFHITKNTVANYKETIYSMASMLNMDYLKNLSVSGTVNHKDMLACRQLIKKNLLINYLKLEKYKIYNNSFVDIEHEEKVVQHLFPTNRELLTHQTLINRIIYVFGAKLSSEKQIIKFKKRGLADNIKVEQLTNQILLKKERQPKFVYTHFNMPHWPYFFNKKGKEVSIDSLTDAYKANKKAYIEYLEYCNTRFLNLIDNILKNSTSPPIILLMSDHGFRKFRDEEKVDPKYYFMNLNAVFLPSGNYSGFYDGMSNVNQFRIILNTVFNQKLPMLKDSVSFLGIINQKENAKNHLY